MITIGSNLNQSILRDKNLLTLHEKEQNLLAKNYN